MFTCESNVPWKAEAQHLGDGHARRGQDDLLRGVVKLTMYETRCTWYSWKLWFFLIICLQCYKCTRILFRVLEWSCYEGSSALGLLPFLFEKTLDVRKRSTSCLVDAGFMHSLCCFCLLKLICLATPKPEPGRAGQNSYQRSNRYTLTLSFPTFVHVPKENFVSYFIVEWGPCSRIKLGTLGGVTRRRYHLAWSHNVTCYNSLHVIQEQIDLRFCVAGQQNGAREAVWSLCFVTLEECEMRREVRRMKIYQVSQKTKAVRLQTLHFAIVTPVERHALRTSFAFPC